MKFFAKVFAVAALAVIPSFAADNAADKSATKAALEKPVVSESVATVDSAAANAATTSEANVATASEASATASDASAATVSDASAPAAENAEVALRDSLLVSRDSSCSMEKEALRSELETEKAKCENWQKSYETVKKDNETCALALSVSLGATEEQKKSKSQAMAMSGSSFLGGVGLGMLLYWLIFAK